jgi:hypothetical protein
MKILFDQGTPVPLRRHLHPHTVDTAAERGWSALQNGVLLRQIELAGYAVFVTTDQNIRYQQSLKALPFGIVALGTTSWPKIQRKVKDVRQAVTHVKAGECLFVEIE